MFMSSGLPALVATALGAAEQVLGPAGDVLVVEQAEPVGVDDGDHRVDPPYEVGTAGGGVLVGRGEQRADPECDGLVRGHALRPSGLDPVLGVHTAGAVGHVVGFFVLAAGGVVREHATPA